MESMSDRDAGQDWYAFTARRVVGNAMGVAESELIAESRDKKTVAFARQVAMYLAHVGYQLTYAEVADAFGRERTTVAHACMVVEDARDEGTPLDRLLDTLEQRLRDLAELSTGHPTAARLAAHGAAALPL